MKTSMCMYYTVTAWLSHLGMYLISLHYCQSGKLLSQFTDVHMDGTLCYRSMDLFVLIPTQLGDFNKRLLLFKSEATKAKHSALDDLRWPLKPRNAWCYSRCYWKLKQIWFLGKGSLPLPLYPFTFGHCCVTIHSLCFSWVTDRADLLVHWGVLITQPAGKLLVSISGHCNDCREKESLLYQGKWSVTEG